LIRVKVDGSFLKKSGPLKNV